MTYTVTMQGGRGRRVGPPLATGALRLVSRQPVLDVTTTFNGATERRVGWVYEATRQGTGRIGQFRAELGGQNVVADAVTVTVQGLPPASSRPPPADTERGARDVRPRRAEPADGRGRPAGRGRLRPVLRAPDPAAPDGPHRDLGRRRRLARGDGDRLGLPPPGDPRWPALRGRHHPPDRPLPDPLGHAGAVADGVHRRPGPDRPELLERPVRPVLLAVQPAVRGPRGDGACRDHRRPTPLPGRRATVVRRRRRPVRVDHDGRPALGRGRRRRPRPGRPPGRRQRGDAGGAGPRRAARRRRLRRPARTASCCGPGPAFRGVKTFTYTLVPQGGGTFDVPAAPWTYFDPTDGRYKTLRTDPVEIRRAGRPWPTWRPSPARTRPPR